MITVSLGQRRRVFWIVMGAILARLWGIVHKKA
jgi:hypothetical protein